MKWIFLGALLLFIPTLATILRSNPRYLVPCSAVLGLMPFVIHPFLYVAPISWAHWPGPVKGVEVSLLDGIALAIVIATTRVRLPLALKLGLGVVAIAVGISSLAGNQLMPAMFYAWQLARTVLLFVAVVRVCATVRDAPLAIVTGLGIGLCYEAALAIAQYSSGVLKPGGNLGHSNFLGLATHFVLYPSLGFLLAGRRTALFLLVVIASVVIALVGGSRATVGLIGVGIFLTVAVSLYHRAAPRKYAAGALIFVLLLVAAPAALISVDYRTEEAKESSDTERASMKEAAQMIISDHPFGVGANQYLIVANLGGYSERAGVNWTSGSRRAPVHDFYYLVTAELGFLGLLGFVGILSSLIFIAWFGVKKDSVDLRSEIIPGLFVTLVMVAIHIRYEWVFMDFIIHYLLAITAGMLIGTRYSLRLSAQPRFSSRDRSGRKSASFADTAIQGAAP